MEVTAAGAWIAAVEGTPTGATLAIVLALVSAFAHALFGALQKGRFDPWLVRGAIDASFFALTLPIALFLLPPPTWELVPVLIGVWAVHTVYKAFQGLAYMRGAYTVVYPVARGTAPLAIALAVGVVFGERFGPGQWLGLLMLSGGIMALSVVNLRAARAAVGADTTSAADRALAAAIRPALALALITGVLIAAYTVYDAWGIRLAADPFTFLAWFFVVDGWTFPIVAALRWRRMPAAQRPDPRALMRRGLFGAVVGWASFGSIMLATRLDKVGEAAALRETSVIFAALLGWLLLREPVGPVRAGLMVVIGLGAVLVEFG